MKKVIDTIGSRFDAGKTAIKGAGEVYHCNAAIADHGLTKVVHQRATNMVQTHPILTAADALMLAAREVGLLQAISSGERPFHKVRRQLDSAASAYTPSVDQAGGMLPAA